MGGIKDLNKLIKSMKPALVKDNFVFCTLPEKQFSKLKIKPT
ncbi:MAG: ACT domain-containing protein [archaeon]